MEEYCKSDRCQKCKIFANYQDPDWKPRFPHGGGKRGGLREYARQMGKTQQYISQMRQAAEVFEKNKSTTQVVDFQDKAKHLFSIHSTPKELWPMLAEWVITPPDPSKPDKTPTVNQLEDDMTELTITQQPGAAALAMIARADHLAESTKRQYRKALSNYLATGASLTDAGALGDYALTLPQSSRAFLKSAVRLWAESLENEVKGQATPENVATVQAAVYRLEALNGAITVKQAKGQKMHTWLSKAEVKRLLDTCDDSIVGQRDRLLLGLLVAAGLRREEAARLRFEDVKLIPRGDRFRTVLAVKGKGAKDRSVPISDSLANAIDAWAVKVGGEGYILRSLGQARQVGESMSTVAIFDVVRKRGEAMGKPDLAPHDLRRTFCQIGHDEGVPLTQLAVLMGHANVETTRRYLNLDLDLDTTPSDFVPF